MCLRRNIQPISGQNFVANYVNSSYSDATNDYMGMDTFSIAEYTLRNIALRAGQ